MKKIKFLRWFTLTTAAGLAASCSTMPVDDMTYAPRFHEGADADVVVRFYSWKAIQVLRPDIREDGFLPLLDRNTVGEKFDRPGLGRNLAVVVVGYMFTKAEEADLVGYWNTLLRERGFRRVVLVRAGFKNEIDGLPIVHDSAMSAAHEPPVPSAAPVARFASAAGADAPHPSSRFVR
jgi:hypothetical protein